MGIKSTSKIKIVRRQTKGNAEPDDFNSKAKMPDLETMRGLNIGVLSYLDHEQLSDFGKKYISPLKDDSSDYTGYIKNIKPGIGKAIYRFFKSTLNPKVSTRPHLVKFFDIGTLPNDKEVHIMVEPEKVELENMDDLVVAIRFSKDGSIEPTRGKLVISPGGRISCVSIPDNFTQELTVGLLEFVQKTIRERRW